MKRKIIILLAACVAAAPLQAQNLEFGGLTYNNDLMMSCLLYTSDAADD